MSMTGAVTWERCRIFPVSQPCPISSSPSQASLAQLPTRLPLQLCPVGMQTAGHSRRAVSRNGTKSVVRSWAAVPSCGSPSHPRAGREDGDPDSLGTASLLTHSEDTSSREFKQKHCIFWCCISKPKLNNFSSGSKLK